MDVASWITLFGSTVSAAANIDQRTGPRTIRSVSVITGRDIVLKVPASSERERRIDRYRRSSDSRLLSLND